MSRRCCGEINIPCGHRLQPQVHGHSPHACACRARGGAVPRPGRLSPDHLAATCCAAGRGPRSGEMDQGTEEKQELILRPSRFRCSRAQLEVGDTPLLPHAGTRGSPFPHRGRLPSPPSSTRQDKGSRSLRGTGPGQHRGGRTEGLERHRPGPCHLTKWLH